MFPDRVEKEVAVPALTAGKYAAVHEVGLASGFIAPRVLGANSRFVLLEHIPDIRSLRDLYISRDRKALDLAVGRAGEILGLLHAKLHHASAACWTPPPKFVEDLQGYTGTHIDIERMPRAILHGDYSFANVFVQGNVPEKLVIIDPCANYGSTFEDWTSGPIYIDIGKMLSCLEGQVSPRHQHRVPSAGRIAELQERFIGGYERFGAVIDRSIAHGFAFGVASAQFRRRFGRLSGLHRLALYNVLRGNFPGTRKLKAVAKVR
jgi:hypothetical protein